MRQSEIRGYATRYLDNIANNNGKCEYGFMAELVREASSVTDVEQIKRDDIRNEVARIVAKQRKVSPESSGTPKVSTTINEPLDGPLGDVLQVSVGIDVLARAAANPQPPPLVAGGDKFDEAAVAVTEDHFLSRVGVNVQKTNNIRGPDRHFSRPSKVIRKSWIRWHATRYLDNVANNNGKCEYGFMAELVRETSDEMDTLQITRDDIRHEVARIVDEQRKVAIESSGSPKASTTINDIV